MSCDCDYFLEKGAVEEQHYSNCSSKNQTGRRCRNPDGSLILNNKHLKDLKEDHLYHLSLGTATHDLPALFGDVKFVCLGGKDARMLEFAKYMAQVLGSKEPLTNLTEKSGRYAMYKVGPVLSMSHGIGIPSMITALQEAIKLVHYAKAKDPVFLRIGSSGGLNIPAGTVVISEWGLNGMLEKVYELPVMGRMTRRPSYLDRRLAQELFFLSKGLGFDTVIGGTMGADDFYRGQARLDGPFCDYEEADKMAFLKRLVDMGVRNIEMESTAFSALTAEAGIRAGILCVTYLDRLHGDQVTADKETIGIWENRPMEIVCRLVKKYMDGKKK